MNYPSNDTWTHLWLSLLSQQLIVNLYSANYVSDINIIIVPGYGKDNLERNNFCPERRLIDYKIASSEIFYLYFSWRIIFYIYDGVNL